MNLSVKTLDRTILEIISMQRIPDQRAMLHELELRGHEVIQSTLSRHFRKLNIHKKDGYYHYQGESGNASPELQSVKKVIMIPPNLLVVKTLPGYAMAISWQLDQRKYSGIQGTVAGDDNVFIAISPPEMLQIVYDQIRETFCGEKV